MAEGSFPINKSNYITTLQRLSGIRRVGLSVHACVWVLCVCVCVQLFTAECEFKNPAERSEGSRGHCCFILRWIICVRRAQQLLKLNAHVAHLIFTKKKATTGILWAVCLSMSNRDESTVSHDLLLIDSFDLHHFLKAISHLFLQFPSKLSNYIFRNNCSKMATWWNSSLRFNQVGTKYKHSQTSLPWICLTFHALHINWEIG